MAYTFLDFQTKVATRVKNESPNTVKDAINVAYYEICREQAAQKKAHELFVADIVVDITGMPAGTPADLPLDFMLEERFRYKVGTKIWRLPNRITGVTIAGVFGKPRCYSIVAGTTTERVLLFPYDGISFGPMEALLLSYYKVPELLSADADQPVSHEWDNLILKRACDWVYQYSGRLDQAKAILATMGGNASTPPQTQPD